MAERNGEDLRDRPIGELMGELARETSTLVRKELELAKVEMTEKGRRAGVGAGMLGGATAAALLALGSATAFAILVLDLVMPTWAAALIVTAIWAVVAFVLAQRGRDKVQEAGPVVPEQTIDTMKEDVEWAKNRMPSGRK